MGVVEGLCDGCYQLGGFIVARTILLDAIIERATFDKLGDDINGAVVGSAHIMHGNDVRMIQTGNRSSFGQILLGIFWFLETLGGWNLDGDLSLEFLIIGEIDPTKRPFAKDTFQAIPTKLAVAYRLVADIGFSWNEAIFLTVFTRCQFRQPAA